MKLKRTYIYIAVLVLSLAGIIAGVILTSQPIDIRNRASELAACSLPAQGTCKVNVNPNNFIPFRMEVVDDEGTIIGHEDVTDAQSSVVVIRFSPQSQKQYVCRVVPLDPNSGCSPTSVTGDGPVCVNTTPGVSEPVPTITVTPTPILPSVTPTTGPSVTPIPSPTTTPAITQPVTPTPQTFPGCPIIVRSIEPELCPLNEARTGCIGGI